jgi:essential MCU regulator, mitochondrial
MALARLGGVVLNVGKQLKPQTINVVSARSVVYTESGAIMQRPERVSWGMVKVMVVMGSSIWLGGTISKNGAAFLEEHDIFVPDDDDD